MRLLGLPAKLGAWAAAFADAQAAQTHTTTPTNAVQKNQVLVIALAIFALALLDTFYPYNRGAMLSACLVLYALTAGVAGERGGGGVGVRERAPWERAAAVGLRGMGGG